MNLMIRWRFHFFGVSISASFRGKYNEFFLDDETCKCIVYLLIVLFLCKSLPHTTIMKT